MQIARVGARCLQCAMAYQIIATRTEGASPKSSTPGGPLFHCIDLKLSANDPKELESVRLVKFELPRSFKDHCKFSDNGPSFPIQIWTPGFFDVIVRVFHGDGSEEVVEGRVQWVQGAVPTLVTFQS